MGAPDYTVATAIEQVEKCEFECVGGPLANNTGWRWLKERLTSGPKYALGDWVWYDVVGEVSGISISQKVRLCVVGIWMDSDTAGRTWRYSLSSDPPSAYHYGKQAEVKGAAEGALTPGGTYQGAAVAA